MTIKDALGLIEDERTLLDGVYDVSDISYHYLKKAEYLSDQIDDEGVKFIERHGKENIWIAVAYQVYGIFLLNKKPEKFKGSIIGYHSRGSCAIFSNCPNNLLIIAEDD